MNKLGLALILAFCLTAPSVLAATFQVQGTNDWTSTNIQVTSGDRITISASGNVKIAGSDPGYNPDGVVETTAADVQKLVCPLTNREYALIGRIGSGTCFFIGASKEITAEESGALYLGVNDRVGLFGDNSGSWTVDVQTSANSSGSSSGGGGGGGTTSYAGGGGTSSASNSNVNNNQEVNSAGSGEQNAVNSPRNCEPGFVGSSYCKDNEVYRAFTLDSCDVSEKVVKRCNAPEKCLDGQCVKVCATTNECTPGSKRCDGNAYQSCIMSDDGCFKWSAKTNCKTEEICLEGQCNAKQGEMIQTSAPSIQLKRTNEGIPGIKPAEIIFDVVNIDLGNSLEGFLLCKSPDDAVISSTMGAGSGSGAQYVSPRFIIDVGPSQKSITITLDSDTPGEKRATCVIKYAFFKEQAIENGTVRKYIKNDGSFTTEMQDSLFKEARLDKTVLFKNEIKEEPKGNMISRFFNWLSRLFGGE